MEQTELDLEHKVAKTIVTVTDGGQHGFSSCGNCNYTLEKTYNVCPECDYNLVGIQMGPTFGGSDF